MHSPARVSDTVSSAGNAGLPGDEGVWFFIVADMFAFGVFFLLFTVGRAAAPDLYEASRQHLDLRFGLANTLVLLTSGACMARAVHEAAEQHWEAARRWIAFTAATGALFGVSKAFEWHAKITNGIRLTTNEFFTYYFVFTGIHFLHFVIGIAVLAVLFRVAGSADAEPARRTRWIEAGGAYWHMVDLLWIVLFAMLYLMRAA